MSEGAGNYELRSATGADADRVSELVGEAYGHYTERIGFVPGPMREDYSKVIAEREVTVAEGDAGFAGIIVIGEGEEGFLIDNVAVHPSHQGTGVGRALLEHAEAEAQAADFDSIYLFTHELMNENLTLYEKIGYVEYDRRSKGDFSLVFMRKPLGR